MSCGNYITAHFDRALLPNLVSYVQQHTRVIGRGRQRRADCLIAEHSHALSMAIDVERALWFCHACGAGGDVLDLHRRRFGLSFIDAARELGALADDDEPGPAPRPNPPVERPPEPDHDDDIKRARIARIRREVRPVRGTPVELYLRGRGCSLPPPDGGLGFHTDLRIFGFAGPAMVGKITDATDPAVLLGLHCTWLRQDGVRWVRGERRYLGRKAGGVIRLHPDEAVTHGLALAEGIESALAAGRVFAPIWSCLDAGGLANFPALPGVEALTIFADRDESGTGQKAAAACAERWRDAGREVRVLAALRTGADMADLTAGVTA